MSADYAPLAAQNTCQVFERGSTQLGLPPLPRSPASQESPPGMIYRSPALGSVPVAPSASHPPTPSPRHFSNPSPREALISTGVTSSGLDQSQECQDLQSALSDHASSRSSVKDSEADNCATTPGLADQSPAWATTYPSHQQVRVSTRRIPYQAQAQAYRAALKELATTKLVGGEKPISQAVFLRVVTNGGAAGKEISELFEFRRPCHKPHSNASTILNLNEKQHNAMYALAGCSDVTSVMSHVKKQVRDAMEEVYGIDKIRFRTWFKNRRSTPKKINLRMDKTPNPNRSDPQHPDCDASQHLVQAGGELNAVDELMMPEAAKVGSKRQRSTGARAAARPRAAPKAARSLSPKTSLNASPPPPSNVSNSCRPSSAAMPATPDAPTAPPAYTLITPPTCKPARRRSGQSHQDQQMEIMSHCLDPLPSSLGAYPQRIEGRMQHTPADARSPLIDRNVSMWIIPSEAVAAVAAAAAASACEQLLEGHPQHMQQQQRGSSPRTPAMRQHMLVSAESTPPAVYSHAQAAYAEPIVVAKLEPSQEQQQLGSDPWFSNALPDNMTAMPGLEQLTDVLDGNVGAGLEHMSDDDLWLDIFGFNQQQLDEPPAADTHDNMHAMSMQQQHHAGAWISQYNAEENAWMAANSGYMQRRVPDAVPVPPYNGHGQFAMPCRAQEAEPCNAHGMNARDAFIYGQSKMVHDALPEQCFPGHAAGFPAPSADSALTGFNPELVSGGRGPQDTQRVYHQSSVTMPVTGGPMGHFAGHQQPNNFHELHFLDDLPGMEEWQHAV